MMQMKKEPDSQDNTHLDDLNNYKFHLCICEKPIYFVFLQMHSVITAESRCSFLMIKMRLLLFYPH